MELYRIRPSESDLTSTLSNILSRRLCATHTRSTYCLSDIIFVFEFLASISLRCVPSVASARGGVYNVVRYGFALSRHVWTLLCPPPSRTRLGESCFGFVLCTSEWIHFPEMNSTFLKSETFLGLKNTTVSDFTNGVNCALRT